MFYSFIYLMRPYCTSDGRRKPISLGSGAGQVEK